MSGSNDFDRLNAKLTCQRAKLSEKSEQALTTSQTEMKIAAYNFEYGKNATATEIGEALKSYNFDVVCFSEAPGGNWTKEVGDAMGLTYFTVGKYSTTGHENKYKTIAS